MMTIDLELRNAMKFEERSLVEFSIIANWKKVSSNLCISRALSKKQNFKHDY